MPILPPIKNKKYLRGQDFAPLGPDYGNQLEYEQAIRRRTAGIIQPQLQGIRDESLQQRQAHHGRVGDLQNWYKFYLNNLRGASQGTTDALNKLISLNAGSNETAQSNLQAALNRAREIDAAQANAVGGQLRPGDSADTMLTAGALGNAGVRNLTGQFGQTEALARGRVATGALGRTRSLEDEAGRARAIFEQLRKQKHGIIQSIPQVEEQVRKDVSDEQLAKAAERARESIARGTLGVQKGQLHEQVRHDKAQEGIDWAGVHNDRAAIRASAGDNATQAQQNAAKAAQAKYDSGVQLLQSYEENVKPKNINPEGLFRKLTAVVPPRVALRIMTHSGFNKIAQWAHNALHGQGVKNEPWYQNILNAGF